MPATVVKSLAKKAGVSVDKAEKLWSKAKATVSDGGTKDTDSSYYARVVGTLKKMLRVEALDLVLLGWDPESIVESLISSRSIDVVSNIVDKSYSESDWCTALNLRILLEEYVHKKISSPAIFRRIRKCEDSSELSELYSSLFEDLNRSIVDKVVESVEGIDVS